MTILAALMLALSPPITAQSRITTPKEELGFNFGDDYHLANYKQISAYWQKLASQSNRIVVCTIVFFDNSPVFRLTPEAAAQGIKAIAWFDNKTSLRSGWAWGQEHLADGVIAIEARIGRGKFCRSALKFCSAPSPTERLSCFSTASFTQHKRRSNRWLKQNFRMLVDVSVFIFRKMAGSCDGLRLYQVKATNNKSTDSLTDHIMEES